MECFHKMEGMNIELTTKCPLHCSQCYCSLEDGKDIDINIAKAKLDEAERHGVQQVHLSGGETLCYPNLFELIEYAAQKCKTVNVALSGWNFDKNVLQRLVDSNVSGIYVSLNGSSEEINSITRDGFDYAINALKVMQDFEFEDSYINWVMHSNNCDDFQNVLKIAENYNVGHLVVLAFKPDSSHRLNSFPSGEQIRKTAEFIKNYKGSVKIMVEACFSQLLAVIKDTVLFGNLNLGSMKGCRAGVYNYNISVDGMYSPCRHLDFFEDYDTLDEYLEKSEIIKIIRNVEQNKKEPCIECRYCDYCKPCLAISSKLYGSLYIGHKICSLYK